jgi:hypothetical protein
VQKILPPPGFDPRTLFLWLYCHKFALWMFVFTDVGLRNCYICMCVAWLGNCMQSSTVKKVIKDVYFFNRFKHGIAVCHV